MCCPENDFSGTKVEVRNEHMLDLFLWTLIKKLVGGFKYFLFSPLPGEMIQFD